ncbi:rhamnan synthesis F family protein [Synechococcus sp. M16CYN]|uniref:rhamnan synthesis F family protein n=1 Tax=Synechococcus sp. M16CYN TaxID=3103139 RepID=UPI00325092D6
MTKNSHLYYIDCSSSISFFEQNANIWYRWINNIANDAEIHQWQSELVKRHKYLPKDLLDPRLLPLELLCQPETWIPTSIGLNPEALLNAHPDLTHCNQLLISGRLKAILYGEASLYNDLPPIHIQAYKDGLRSPYNFQSLNALEHLSGIGRQCFRSGSPLGKDLDRYQPPTPDKAPEPSQKICHHLLVVLHDTQADTEIKKWQKTEGWISTIHKSLNNLTELAWPEGDEFLISFCHSSDRLVSLAAQRIANFAALHPYASLFSSDETLQWSKDPAVAAGNRQNRVALTPMRLLCRGGIGGLITFRSSTLRMLQVPKRALSMHTLMLDLALQHCANGYGVAHCPEVLLQRSVQNNPTIPDVASPADRLCWKQPLINEALTVSRYRGQSFLNPGGSLTTHSTLGGCHQLQLQPDINRLISIFIPFRDKVDLTSTCVSSLRRCAGSIAYELILIDNSSRDPATQTWLALQQKQHNVTVIRYEGSFNHSRINNIGRRYARGSYLLFVNNDIEFRSPNVLQALLDPFAFRSTVAVGAKLNYPDGAVQHQGVVLIKGERRCVVEPGKHIKSVHVLESLTPLCVQEEFSAATAACLLIRSTDFDQVGGFDEQLSVAFNDVDLCLRLREIGGTVAVTPFVDILHHESVSRGKDHFGESLARHQRESGLLRYKHRNLFTTGDPLTSHLIHPHSTRYQPRETQNRSAGPVSVGITLHWRRPGYTPRSNRPILLFAHYDKDNQLRPDLFYLLQEYNRYADVIFVSAVRRLRWRLRTMHRLKQLCAAIIVRHNQGYDFGSWMSGIRRHQSDIKQAAYLILTNDSFWGPITPLGELFNRIETSKADAIGLSDNLMYEPHLSSAFVAYKPTIINSSVFNMFWNELECWPRKRDLVKQCEVRMSASLRQAGFAIESLYTHNSNGNVLHYNWKQLIEERRFPFIKVSLLRDNPTRQFIADWPEVIGKRNPKLAGLISRSLLQKSDLIHKIRFW